MIIFVRDAEKKYLNSPGHCNGLQIKLDLRKRIYKMNELPKCAICKQDAYPIKHCVNGFNQFAFRITILKGIPIYQCEHCFVEWNKIAEELLDKFIKEGKIEKGVLII